MPLEKFLDGNELPWNIIHDENGRNPTGELVKIFGNVELPEEPTENAEEKPT